MISRKLQRRLSSAFVLFALVFILTPGVQAQTGPLTSRELVSLVYQLPAHPEKRDSIIEEIRKRGIDFELTSGLRSVVATKSGNDVLLRRTLEEAERRRLNPTTAAALPAEAEAQELLSKARAATLAAVKDIPDFVVKQLITRYQARGTTRNWTTLDRLTVAVSYSESVGGEQYKLLAINGMPEAVSGEQGMSYRRAGGSTTTGEFASLMIKLFSEESRTVFKVAGVDTLRGRSALIYNFEIRKGLADQTIVYGDVSSVKTGLRGMVWIDRENFRVLRTEMTFTEIEPDFPVKKLDKRIDYDWVTIADKRYVLPIEAEAVFTAESPVTFFDPRSERRVTEVQTFQSRNLIRFRNYQKYGAEVKIIEDIDDFEDEQQQPKKPDDKPEKKP
jgi:hypothetical protein